MRIDELVKAARGRSRGTAHRSNLAGFAEYGRVPSPDKPGRRAQEITSYSTMARSLLGLGERLRALGVGRVVMEATSDYWEPVFYLLEAHGLDPWLVNAKDVKHLPGRPKTDRLDALWLAKVAGRQMIRPSFLPPPQIRLLRDLTRYRVDLIKARTAEQNRVEKLLEDAQIKLSVVVEKLDEITGVGPTAAHVVIAEIGIDMSRFPTAAHLCSWARFAPGIKESAGKNTDRGDVGPGNPYLAPGPR